MVDGDVYAVPFNKLGSTVISNGLELIMEVDKMLSLPLILADALAFAEIASIA